MHASSRSHRLRFGVAVASLTAILLTGCAAIAPPDQSAGEAAALLATYDLDGLDAREIIEQLDTAALDDRPEGLIASIEPDQLILTSDTGERATLPMPDDEFYVAIAPYIGVTHACHFHSPTGCQGELRHAEVQITVTDQETGGVLHEATTRTSDNGFVGLWLPRDVAATVAVSGQGGTGTASIDTGSQDATCITTLQLT